MYKETKEVYELAKGALPLTALIRTPSLQHRIYMAKRRKAEVTNDCPRKRGIVNEDKEDMKKASDNNNNDY